MPKKGSLDSFQIKGGLGKKEGGRDFLGVGGRGWVDNPMHTMYSYLELIDDKVSFNRFNSKQGFSNKS